jgi:tRNA nucleotidyltransferase (CCA-adding enzyme)
VNLVLLRRFLGDGLTPEMRELLSQGLAQMQVQQVGEYRLGEWLLELPEFVPGLAGLVMRLMDLTGVDVLLLVARQGERLSLIGRARQEFAQLGRVMALYGSGGHDCAAAATLKASPEQPLPDPAQVMAALRQAVQERIPPPVTAKDLMSAPVRTIRPEITIDEAQRVLLRYGHSGLVVVDAQGRLVGVISRRDIDIALHHGFGHAPRQGLHDHRRENPLPRHPLGGDSAVDGAVGYWPPAGSPGWPVGGHCNSHRCVAAPTRVAGPLTAVGSAHPFLPFGSHLRGPCRSGIDSCWSRPPTSPMRRA